MDSLAQRLVSVISDMAEIELPCEELILEHELTHIGFNSITFIRAVVFIEEEFEIEFNDEDLDFGRYKTIGDILEYIKAHM